MIKYFERLWAEVLVWATTMSMNDWMVVAGIVVAVGFFAMRGMGSRSAY
ncbi:MAG: hypothetical protein U0795_11395 [Pirellulales bacterium]